MVDIIVITLVEPLQFYHYNTVLRTLELTHSFDSIELSDQETMSVLTRVVTHTFIYLFSPDLLLLSTYLKITIHPHHVHVHFIHVIILARNCVLGT